MTTEAPPPPKQTTKAPTPPLVRMGSGRIEAENYDSYSDDTSPNNNGGKGKDDAVDKQETSDIGGGLNVGWTDPGEKLNYKVNLPSSGRFVCKVRVATNQEMNPKIWLTINGRRIDVNLPYTDGWQTWRTHTVNLPSALGAGIQDVTIEMRTSGINLNWFEFTPI